MITVYLIFTLVAGEMHDVDAFKDMDACRNAHAKAMAFIEHAHLTKPDLDMGFSGCVPIEVEAPKAKRVENPA